MFIARHQLAFIDVVCLHQVGKEIVWHGAVVNKTTHIANLTLLDLLFYLFDNLVGVGGIVYQNIGIARYLDAIAAIYLIAGKDDIEIGLDDVFDEHDVVVLANHGELDEARHLAIGQFHYKVSHAVVWHRLFFL